jgi:hypothetical protein
MNIVINQTLTTGRTYFSRDTAPTNTIPVENSEQLQTANGLIVFGVIGSPNAELTQVLSSKTATTLTMGSSLSFSHSKGEPVQQVTFNKVEIESATSPTGPFTVLDTIDIQWASDKTVYTDPDGTSTTYYRQRFYNSVTAVYSDYSNGGVGVAQTDITSSTVGGIIRSVRASTGNTDLKDEFFIDALQDARGVLNTEFGYGRLNEWRQEFEYPIQMLAGTNYVNLPADIDFNETNRTLLNVRYGRQSVSANVPLTYCDKRVWNHRSYANRYSYTSGVTLSGATSIQLETTGDFPASGTFFVATESPTQSIMQVTYTGNNLATNTLTGVTGITRDISSGVQCFSQSTFTFPCYYTVFDGKIWFDNPVPTSLQGKNILIDYYKKISDLTNLSDEIPEHYRDIYKNYLKFAIKRRRDDTIGENDPDYQRFINGAKNILGSPWTGQEQIIVR